MEQECRGLHIVHWLQRRAACGMTLSVAFLHTTRPHSHACSRRLEDVRRHVEKEQQMYTESRALPDGTAAFWYVNAVSSILHVSWPRSYTTYSIRIKWNEDCCSLKENKSHNGHWNYLNNKWLKTNITHIANIIRPSSCSVMCCLVTGFKSNIWFSLVEFQ